MYLVHGKDLQKLIVNWLNLTYGFDVMPLRLTRRSAGLLFGGLIWGGLLFAGFSILGHGEFTPAPHAQVSPAFPAKSVLKLDPTRASLFLFVHPQCPCTQATFADLGRLRSETGDVLAVTIIFSLPAHVAADWEKGSLWSDAQAMRGVRVFRDDDGMEAQRFGVKASGHALVFTPSGRLLFSGGITLSRGYEGNNPGSSAIARLVRGKTTSLRQTPVFGCTLL